MEFFGSLGGPGGPNGPGGERGPGGLVGPGGQSHTSPREDSTSKVVYCQFLFRNP